MLDNTSTDPNGYIYFLNTEHAIGDISMESFISVHRESCATWEKFSSLERFEWTKEAFIISHLVANNVKTPEELIRATAHLQTYLKKFPSDVIQKIIMDCLNSCWKLKMNLNQQSGK